MDQQPLTKREVETLLAACEGASGSALEEITVVRSAVSTPLARLLGRLPDPWIDLIDAAAAAGGWDASRRSLLAAAGRPDQHPDHEAVLDALWDLVQELNERRRV